MRVRLVVLGLLVVVVAGVVSAVVLRGSGEETGEREVAEAPAEVVGAVAEEAEAEAPEEETSESAGVAEGEGETEVETASAVEEEPSGDVEASEVKPEPPTEEEARASCENGIAVPRPEENPELVGDCAILLSIRDALSGEASLNWDAGRPMGEWEGVDVRESRGPVWRLALASRGLKGRIPPQLGRLRRLQQLHLNDNQLTGAIPAELVSLNRLERLHLAGNAGLTGCVPPELRDVRGHDLAEVGLEDCPTPPLPPSVSAQPCANGTVVAEPRVHPGLVSDCATLLAVQDVLAGKATLNWDVDTPIIEWEGITLGGVPLRVHGLDLTSRGLTGQIPPGLGGLAELGDLWLGDNLLTGAIPAELGSLRRLWWLWLNDNQLSGPIPAELGGMPRLSWVNLGHNQLGGPIPASLGRLSARHLWLDHNDLSGPIPAELGALPAQTLWLHNNRLSGPIPAELGSLPNLEWLRLDGNRLTGPIPSELAAIPYLWRLDLNDNELSGPIPAELGAVRTLGTLHLSDNELAGAIPAELGALDRLWDLRLDGNRLTGTIPEELGTLANLRELRLNDNQLSGTIPAALGALSELEHLDLSGNKLAGTIPAELGALGGLRELRLQDNDLGNPIPGALGDLRHLEVLGLSGNQLSGAIPATLGELSALEYLWLDGNQLTGPIPSALGELSNLWSLRLHDNQLAGSIPLRLGALSNLWSMRLDGNKLTGPIPRALGDLSNLRFLDLSDNQLGGVVPEALGSLHDLRELRLDGNHFSGPVPASLARLAKLRELRLDGNRLTGPIPATRVSRRTAPYNRLDASGEVATAGSFAFLDSAGDVITTYEGLRGEAAGLRIHPVDAEGMSRASTYEEATVGDVFEWWEADDCWIRYEVTALMPDRPGAEPRKHFAIDWITYAGTGCTGSVPADISAGIRWGPPTITSPDITSPVRHGPYILYPRRWDGHFERWVPIAAPAGARSPDGTLRWPSLDPAQHRQHPLWRDPDLPLGWSLAHSQAQNGGGDEHGPLPVQVVARYDEPGGAEALWTEVRLVDYRPAGRRGPSRPVAGQVTELRIIDGHAALLSYDPGGSPDSRTKVQIFHEETSIEYAVTAIHPSVNDLEIAIAIARSLYR